MLPMGHHDRLAPGCYRQQRNEELLISRANQVVSRRPVGNNPLQVIAQVAAAAQNLRDQHNCDRKVWQYIRGQHRCKECYYTLPLLFPSCRQCHIQVCKRYKIDRLSNGIGL